MNDATADLDRFHTILGRLESAGRQGLQLSEYANRSSFPTRGVYFFREPGEFRSSQPNRLRVVRVGTHAVSANSKSTLRARLKQHLGTRAGGGHHRGSIFRLHVGAALLRRDGVSSQTWGIGSSAPAALRASEALQEDEALLEQQVSRYIGAMTVLWIDVPDEPSATSVRAVIERNAIGLLSNGFVPIDSASPNWLGHQSPRDAIRRSHLWNLNYVDQPYDRGFLDQLEKAVERTCESD